MHATLAAASLLLLSALASQSAAGNADTATLRSKTLTVTLDTRFPRIIAYRTAGGEKLEGQATPVDAIQLNGAAAQHAVTFQQRAADTAEYRLRFPKEAIDVTFTVTVGTAAVELRVSKVAEHGGTLLKTLAFPGCALVTIRSTQPDATLAATYLTVMNDNCGAIFREQIGPLASISRAADTGNYLFLSAGKLAAGVASNDPVDVERTAWKIVDHEGVKTCTAWCPVWRWRELDSETLGQPWARVMVTGDRNGDGKADWQDAALAYRDVMPHPLGAEFVRTAVGENIAMNFASGAQQPFLRILDNIKKIYLATDGLGQQMIIKGFSSEGHDSANTDCGGHYNERAGGLKDFTVLLEQAHQYNARVGIHINVSEVYPEAHRYRPEILQRDAHGNPKGGWCWLDQAHMIDKWKDLTTGQLYAALDQMRRELPRLDFVYVDTYWEHGWPAWKLAAKMTALGLPFYTEGDAPLDPWTTWAHWRGNGSRVMRFLWYSERDLFGNDGLLRSGRADSDGFLGWQNQHSFHNFIHGTFSRRLPAKFLQHFDLLRWEPGKEAVFSDGVKVVQEGNTVTCTQDGRTVMTWNGGGTHSRLFVPWEPKAAKKIYVWDETGKPGRWELPPAWQKLATVYLYKLTAQGRADETPLAVTDGHVTVTAKPGTPYVIYPAKAPEQAPLVWGEGGLVKDPGFESRTFHDWTPGPTAAAHEHLRIEDDAHGNARLVISGNDGAAGEVTQHITGLEGGQTYAASVWVQVRGQRKASLNVHVGQVSNRPELRQSNYVTHTDVRHSAPNDPRTGTNYQRLKVLFDVPKHCRTATMVLRADAGAADTAVEFDDVRVVPCKRSVPADGKQHWFYEDFENVDQGYGPFTCCPGERTHLSEANPPYTHDTINGRFSLKSRDGGRVLRTLPATIRFAPHTRYRLTCETLTAPGAHGRLNVESGGRTIFEGKFGGGRGQVQGEFTTGDDTETFLSLFKDGGDWIALDDLAIDCLGPAQSMKK
jgi:endo-alpha-N-acetylgalactosaminidase